jgi:hypothetical protein
MVGFVVCKSQGVDFLGENDCFVRIEIVSPIVNSRAEYISLSLIPGSRSLH